MFVLRRCFCRRDQLEARLNPGKALLDQEHARRKRLTTQKSDADKKHQKALAELNKQQGAMDKLKVSSLDGPIAMAPVWLY